MSIVLKVENLSKYYRLGVIGGATLREDLSRWWAMRRGKPDPLLKIGEEDHGNRENGQIWALRDISFEVVEGEILGIIGGNGAGKSTLLKILSRITAPTSGSAKIKGRVASLLEVGTGFHPELTGRENIYLNGTILGMSRSEVTRKLDEIVDFAGMDKFIDTPVKRYSSGMTVRLAFAVAAHLEPEILIIDEVLAVGDAEFQRKCLGKMKHIAGHGRTVLFVSHNMGSIKSLCTRGILINAGSIAMDADTGAVVYEYLSSGREKISKVGRQEIQAQGNDVCRLLGVSLLQDGQEVETSVLITKEIEISIDLEVVAPQSGVGVSLNISDSEDNVVVHSSSLMNEKLHRFSKGRNLLIAKLPAHLLNGGAYRVTIAADIPNQRIIFYERNITTFEVLIDCPTMGRYSPEAFKGFSGAGIATWRIENTNQPSGEILSDNVSSQEKKSETAP